MHQRKPRRRSISSFFAPSQPKKKVATPEKVVVARADSRLSQMASRSAFDEFGSSDTSFGLPEVTNFKNPALSRFSSNLTGLPPRRANAPSSSPLKPEKRPVPFDLDRRPKKLARRPTKAAAAAAATAASVALSLEQAAILDAVVNHGQNVFFTGSAGTGKSVVLRQMVLRLHAKHGSSKVGVTASTGLAACNIGGQTVHKYLHLGLGSGSANDIATKIKRNGAAKKRWTSLAVLIIDEILMIDRDLFEKIDSVARVLRGSTAPFGGIQLVCTGDFFQLPPVSKNQGARFCFLSPSWHSAIRHTFVLTTVFRQKGDTELILMLNALRTGSLDDATVAKFRLLARKVTYHDNIEPTELYPTRQEVKAANIQRLRLLPGRLRVFLAVDNELDPFRAKSYDNLMCEKEVELKPGAQVMYLKNHPTTMVVNGSIGTVIGFMPEKLFTLVFDVLGELAFSHVSRDLLQFLVLLCDLVGRNSLSPEESAIINNLPPELHSKSRAFVKEAFLLDPQEEPMPLVNFIVDNLPTVLFIRREDFTVDQARVTADATGQKEEMVRRQLPLLLAWAMSIHKAQGQSIDRLRVDLRKIFERGQVYVALSRATNKDHLEVMNFDPRRITVAPEVKQFYSQLAEAK